MRGKKAIYNTVVSLLEEAVAIICGLIVPRLILSAFGSKYNGLTTSISQFLSCTVLLRSGIIGATRAALYKPLAENDYEKISSIIKATDIFMKKIGAIIGGLIITFALLYPLLVKTEFDWFFTFSLFIIIGISTFAEAFFGTTYITFLQADQKLWIPSLFRVFCYIINTIITALLIMNNFGIHIAKLGSATVYFIYPIVLQLYVKKHYCIDTNAKPDFSVISQRWDAFWHSVSSFVTLNTDVIVLTIFSNLSEVSVFSVYNMIVMGLRKAMIAFTNGLEAAFGNMIAKNEHKVLKNNLRIVEFVLFSISTIVYSTAILSINQFVEIYTKGINDVNYLRPTFSIIILIAYFFNTIRYPYQFVVQAAGKYKETRNGAIFESIINITISIILVTRFGIIGTAIGTLFATIFRTMQYSLFVCKNMGCESMKEVVKKVFIALAEITIIVIFVRYINIANNEINYISWVVNCILYVSIASFVTIFTNIFAFKDEAILFAKKIKLISSKE